MTPHPQKHWWRHAVADAVESLFSALAYPTAFISRLALTILDIWQAYVAIVHNGWYIGDASMPIIFYTYGLAIVAIVILLSNTITWLTLFVLFVNLVQFMYLAIAAIAFDPPMTNTGLYVFTTMMSLTAFWRVALHLSDKRHGDTDGQRAA